MVLGVGGVGSAALFHAAQRGLSVLGVDRFSPPHDRGSSHGQSRVIRQAYFEHSDYVPLLRRAYAMWEALQAAVGRQLFFPTGLLEIGPAEGIVIQGVLRAAVEHHLDVEQLTAADVARRFPGFVVPDGFGAVFEKAAGYLRVEHCIEAHLRAAQDAGAALRSGVQVLGWSVEKGIVQVQTTAGNETADRLIVTAGPWASQWLGELGAPLSVRRKSLFWYECDGPHFEQNSGCPTFFIEVPWGAFYGIPIFDRRGLKIAEHSGGHTVDDPLEVDREIDPNERCRVERFAAENLTGVSTRLVEHQVCLYTMSADEHFLVDTHPEYPQVAFVAGLSGHGFKFAPVLGQAVVDLAVDGRTEAPIEFLSLDRAGLN
jgi:monomeric sarcosine oxidase